MILNFNAKNVRPVSSPLFDQPMFRYLLLLICLFGSAAFTPATPPTLQLALLKYSGGGDWYNDVNSLKNLARFCNQNLRTNFDQEYVTVEPGSADIFNYPIVYATGHGNMLFSDLEARNLRAYLDVTPLAQTTQVYEEVKV